MTTILVVDDSPTMLTGISKILAPAGYDVIHAKNGETGIKMASTDNPDLILMDVVMPDLNGFQATRKLTTNDDTKHIPVIMLTTKDQQTDKVWAQRQGASDYVVKPPDTKELLSKIEKLIKT